MKYLFFVRSFAIVFTLMLITSATKAANRYLVVNNSNWNAPNTWSATQNGFPTASVPGAADHVFIPSGFSLTITANALCASLTFTIISGNPNTGGTLTVNSGIVLNVSGAIIKNNAGTTTSLTKIAGGGTINCASFTVGGTTTIINVTHTITLTSTIATLSISGDLNLNGERHNLIFTRYQNTVFNLFAGSITVGGTIKTDEESGSAVSMSLNNGGAGSGKLTLTGAIPFNNIVGTLTFDAAGSGATVVYSGGPQVMKTGIYNNLTLAGSGSKTSAVTVNTKLSVQGTATAGNIITYSSAILEYKGSEAQITSDNEFPVTGPGVAGSGIKELIIDNTSGVTMNNAKILKGSLTLKSGVFATGNNLTMAPFEPPGITVSRSEGSITGTITGPNIAILVYTGNTKTTGPEFNMGSSVTVSMAANQTLTVNTNKTIGGNLTINSGIVDLSAFTMDRSLPGGTLTVGNTATLKIGGTNTVPSNYTTYTFGAASTIEYNGTNQAIKSGSYGNLVLSGGIKTPVSGYTVQTLVAIDAGATLLMSFGMTLRSAIINVNGTLDFINNSVIASFDGPCTLNMGSNGVIRTVHPNGLGPCLGLGLCPSSLYNVNAVFNTPNIATTGTIEYYSPAATQAITKRDYNNLVISGNGIKEWSPTTPLTINGDITIGVNTPLTFTGGQTINLKGDWINNSMAAFIPGTTIINFNGNAEQIIGGSQPATFNNIRFNNTSPGTAITVATPTFISGIADFTDGIVSTNSSLITFNNNSTVGSTPSDASHIDGPVRKLGGADGETFSFPCGDAGQYEYLRIAATTPYDFTAQYIRTSATAVDPDVTNPILNVSSCDRWLLNPGVSVPVATVDITVSWSDEFPCGLPFVTDPNTLSIANLTAGSWVQAGISGGPVAGSTVVSGGYTRNGVNSFGTFSLANTAIAQNPLRISFNDVKATSPFVRFKKN